MSYKFRVRALNILGESEPSAASRPYVVSGYSNRVYERPVAGPYITFTDAINETTIMLKWMVRFVGVEISECAGSRCVGATLPSLHVFQVTAVEPVTSADGSQQITSGS